MSFGTKGGCGGKLTGLYWLRASGYSAREGTVIGTFLKYQFYIGNCSARELIIGEGGGNCYLIPCYRVPKNVARQRPRSNVILRLHIAGFVALRCTVGQGAVLIAVYPRGDRHRAVLYMRKTSYHELSGEL